MTQIGERVGVSRERVRQAAHWFPERPWIYADQLRDLVSAHPIRRWIEEGYLRTSPAGMVLREEVEVRVAEFMVRPCQYPRCGATVDDIHPNRRFCDEHVPEVRRYRYPVMSTEERRRAHEAVDRWEAKNPERARAIRRRVEAAYRARQRVLREAAS